MLISKSKYAFESTVIFNITRLDVWIVSIENRTIRSYFVTSSWYIVIQSIYYSNQYTVFKVPISFIYLSAVFDSCWSISNLFCFVNTFLKKFKLLTVNFRSQWRRRDSNSWPPACKAGALPTELHPHLDFYSIQRLSPMGLSGLEPPTSRLSGVRSNQLSYKPIFL